MNLGSVPSLPSYQIKKELSNYSAGLRSETPELIGILNEEYGYQWLGDVSKSRTNNNANRWIRQGETVNVKRHKIRAIGSWNVPSGNLQRQTKTRKHEKGVTLNTEKPCATHNEYSR